MLTFVIFINGLALMVLEMAGARLLAPWLGTSIIVWTSIIGVILACLSLGNWLGGQLADKTLAKEGVAPTKKHSSKEEKTFLPKGVGALSPQAYKPLSTLFALAAGLVTVCALTSTPLLQMLSTADLPLHLAAPFATLLLFGLPSLICGMASPYIVRLAICNKPNPGAVIGKLNAIATLGSIVGTFLGGFVLISWFGSATVLLGVAGCFLGAALLVFRGQLSSRLVILTTLLAAGFLLQLESHRLAASGGVDIETQYNYIRIRDGQLENRSARFMQTDPGAFQSGCYLEDPSELIFAYTKFYQLGTFTRPNAQRILILGGGGYSVPKWLLAGKSGLASTNFHLDVVELDPGITKAARDYFSTPLDDPRIAVHHEDARTFLNRKYAQGNAGEYDLILGDVFTSSYTVPFQVGTKEAAAKVHELLAPDGLFVMNIISGIEGDNGRLLRALYQSFASQFATVEIFPVQHPYNATTIQNIILVASKHKESPFTHPAKQIQELVAHRWQKPLPTDIPALTDDFAPVERYTLGSLY